MLLWVKSFAIFWLCWGTIGPLWMLLLWRWQNTLDCGMPNLPNTLRMLLARFAFMAWSKTLESTILGLPELSWLSRSFQLKEKLQYCNQLHILLSQKCFWLLLQCLNLWSISFRIRLHCIFICVAFKAYIV